MAQPKRLSTCWFSQLRAFNEVLIAIDLRFRQRTSMIATGLFPLPGVEGLEGSHPAPTRITMLLDLSKRNDGLNRWAARRRGQGVENLLFIIRTIPAYAPTASSTCNRGADHQSDWTSTSGQPPRRWPRGPPHAVCAKSAVWSNVGGLSTRPHHRPSRLNRPPGASVYRGIGSQHHRQGPLAATRSSSPARPRPTASNRRLDKALRLAQRQPKQQAHPSRSIQSFDPSTPLGRPLSIPLLPQRIRTVRLPRATSARLYDDQFLTRYTVFDLGRGRTAR